MSGTKKDDEVRIRVTRVLQKVGFAEVVGERSGEEAAAGGEVQEESTEETSEEAQPDSEEGYSGEDTENFGEDVQGD